MNPVSRMKKTFLSALVAILYMPVNAHAVFITTSVGDFEVSTVFTQYDPTDDLFTSQVWWGDVFLAEEFAALTNTAFGTPNFGQYSPFFWYTDSDTTGPCSGINEPHAGVYWNQHANRTSPVCAGSPPSQEYTFAIAEAVSVAEPPILIMMGLGFSGIAVIRMRRRNSVELTD